MEHIASKSIVGAVMVASTMISSVSATAVPAYATGLNGYSAGPILSVGDTVPQTGSPETSYQMVGIPDGMGAFEDANGISLFVNHEFPNTRLARPIIGAPRTRGAFVSRYQLDGSTGAVVSGDLAFDTVFAEDTLVGPLAREGNTTPAFARFCAGVLAGADEGFDRPIYFAGEESTGASTFDGKGGQLVAMFDGEAHTLPGHGRYAWENAAIQEPLTDETVVIGLEDGAQTPDSQLWMYVGHKDPDATSVLARNGLTGGQLYVFRAASVTELEGVTGSRKMHEGQLQTGSMLGEWVAIPGDVASMSDVQLETAADAVNAFGFVRIEDGAFHPSVRNEMYFNTTGQSSDPSINTLGRVYKMTLNPLDATGPAILEVLVNADAIAAAGGDAPVSPDNIAVSDDSIMIQEDGTTPSRAHMASKGRDGLIWRIPLTTVPGAISLGDVAEMAPVASLRAPGRDGVAVGPGVWESSGIIDASAMLGGDSWFFNVQAHGPTAAPATDTVEDGQLLILRKS